MTSSVSVGNNENNLTDLEDIVKLEESGDKFEVVYEEDLKE